MHIEDDSKSAGVPTIITLIFVVFLFGWVLKLGGWLIENAINRLAMGRAWFWPTLQLPVGFALGTLPFFAFWVMMQAPAGSPLDILRYTGTASDYLAHWAGFVGGLSLAALLLAKSPRGKRIGRELAAEQGRAAD